MAFIPAEQLKDHFKSLLSPSLTGMQNSYQQLPTNHSDSTTGTENTLTFPEIEIHENGSGSPQGWKFLYRRSTYYWIAFVSAFIQMILGIIGSTLSSLKSPNDDNELISIRYVVTGIYSFLSLIFISIPIWWQSKKHSDPGCPSQVTASSHVTTCAFSISICLVNILCSSIFGILIGGSNPDALSRIYSPVLAILLSVSAAALYIATRITYHAAVRSRGTGSVIIPFPPPSPLTLPAWRFATTAESQSLLMEGPYCLHDKERNDFTIIAPTLPDLSEFYV